MRFKNSKLPKLSNQILGRWPRVEGLIDEKSLLSRWHFACFYNLFWIGNHRFSKVNTKHGRIKRLDKNKKTGSICTNFT